MHVEKKGDSRVKEDSVIVPQFFEEKSYFASNSISISFINESMNFFKCNFSDHIQSLFQFQ